MKPRTKMSRQDLIDLFPPYSQPGRTPTRATNKGHVHTVNPAYKRPPLPDGMRLWQWKKLHNERRMAKRAAKAAVK